MEFDSLSDCEMQFIIQHFSGQSSGNVIGLRIPPLVLTLHINLVNQRKL